MADASPTAANVRLVSNDPEDTRDVDAASGYTAPAKGDVVAISGNNEVDLADATDANSLVEAYGVVVDVKDAQTSDGSWGKRLTVAFRGLLAGFSGLTAGDVLYTSTTAGDWEDADPTTTGVTGKKIGLVVSATEVELVLPSL